MVFSFWLTSLCITGSGCTHFTRNDSNSLFLMAEPGLRGGSDGKVSVCNAEDPGLIPGWGRSPGEGNGNPLHYSCLENTRTEELGRIQSMGLRRVRHDWATSFSKLHCIHQIFIIHASVDGHLGCFHECSPCLFQILWIYICKYFV